MSPDSTSSRLQLRQLLLHYHQLQLAVEARKQAGSHIRLRRANAAVAAQAMEVEDVAQG